jgi:hypothetical protein
MPPQVDPQLPAQFRKGMRKGLLRSVLLLFGLIAVAVLMALRNRPEVLAVIPATALDDLYRPVEATNTYRPDEVFFVSVEIENYDPYSPLSARWLYEGDQIAETPLEIEGSVDQYAGFALRSDVAPWPTGNYTVEIVYKKRVLGEAAFRVEEE